MIEGAAPVTSRVLGDLVLSLPVCADVFSRLALSQLLSIMSSLRLPTTHLSTVFTTWYVFGGRDLLIDIAGPGEIERSEIRSESLSPVQCPDEELLRGQMLAGGLWSDVVIEIVWASPRHAGTRESIAPYHWMILQSARLNMIPSNGSLFDLSPGESSEYFNNYFSRCRDCEKRWWLVDTPVLGICPVCEVATITCGLDVGKPL